MRTWKGRVSPKPRRLEPLGMGLTHAEKTYFKCMMGKVAMEEQGKGRGPAQDVTSALIHWYVSKMVLS